MSQSVEILKSINLQTEPNQFNNQSSKNVQEMTNLNQLPCQAPKDLTKNKSFSNNSDNNEHSYSMSSDSNTKVLDAIEKSVISAPPYLTILKNVNVIKLEKSSSKKDAFVSSKMENKTLLVPTSKVPGVSKSGGSNSKEILTKQKQPIPMVPVPVRAVTILKNVPFFKIAKSSLKTDMFVSSTVQNKSKTLIVPHLSSNQCPNTSCLRTFSTPAELIKHVEGHFSSILTSRCRVVCYRCCICLNEQPEIGLILKHLRTHITIAHERPVPEPNMPDKTKESLQLKRKFINTIDDKHETTVSSKKSAFPGSVSMLNKQIVKDLHRKNNHNIISAFVSEIASAEPGPKIKKNEVLSVDSSKRLKLDNSVSDQRVEQKKEKKITGNQKFKQYHFASFNVPGHGEVKENMGLKQCICCGFRTNRRKSMLYHIGRNHVRSLKDMNGTKIWDCMFCPQFYKNTGIYNILVHFFGSHTKRVSLTNDWKSKIIHKMNRGNLDVLYCDKCSQKMYCYEHYMHHIMADTCDGPYKCRLCGHLSTTVVSMNAHKLQNHLSNLEQQQQLYCNFCCESFPSNKERQAHMINCHYEDRSKFQTKKVLKDPSITKLEKKSKKDGFLCQYCGHWLRKSNGMRHHELRHFLTKYCKECYTPPEGNHPTKTIAPPTNVKQDSMTSVKHNDVTGVMNPGITGVDSFINFMNSAVTSVKNSDVTGANNKVMVFTLNNGTVTGVKTSDVTGVKNSDVTGVKTRDVTGVKNSDVTGVKTTDVTGVKTRGRTGVKNSNVTGVKNSDVTDVRNSDVTGVKNSGRTGVKNSGVIGVKNSDVTDVRNSDVTGVKNSGRTGVKNRGRTGVKNSDVTGVKNSDVTGVKNSDLIGVKNSGRTGVKNSDLIGVKTRGRTGVKNSGVTDVKNSDVTGVKNSNVTDVKNSDVTDVKNSGVKNSGVTGVKNSDVTGVKNSDVTGVKSSGFKSNACVFLRKASLRKAP